MTKQHVNVIGAGGHAKVIVSLVRELGYEVAGLFDDDSRKWQTTILAVPVVGPIERISDAPQLPALIAIGDNSARKALDERFDLEWLTAIHPRAYVDSTVELAEGTVVMAGAVVQTLATLGRHVIVNSGAVVEHDCALADFVHVAPGSRLAGNGTLEAGVLFGVGAVAIPGIKVGRWTTVGAGATVVGNLPPHVIAKGVPARFEAQPSRPEANA